MSKYLVIVESPAKAKTINKYLGKDYAVMASYGHVRDLIAKDGAVDPDEGFAMKYALIEKNERHVSAIAGALKKAEALYLATDPDREGEAISWHLHEILKERGALKGKAVHRVVFYEITKSAIAAAMAQPRPIASDLVNAQQARRALDHLVGFNLSPLLWRKVRPGLSAGRVQSPALRLIVEREEEIEKFVPREYWSIEADCEKSAQGFSARLIQFAGEKIEQFSVTDEARAKTVERTLLAAARGKLSAAAVEKKQRRRFPAPPFTTSTLQQEANRNLGFTAQRTMRTAQQLYEGIDIGGETVGLISYMRTDSVSLAAEAIAEIRGLVGQRYGKASVPEEPRTYKAKSANAQEAHEAVRPTSALREPDSLRDKLSPEQFKLYDLIWKRTVACQMQPALYDTVTADMAAGAESAGHRLRATGSTLIEPGYLAVYQEGRDDEQDDESKTLPPLEQGDSVKLLAIKPEQHFTEPPPRYTEATLVKTLEEYDIGRPSTYASIISTLQYREYATLDQRRFKPTDTGRIVNRFLTLHFTRYVDYEFTAHFEDELDEISRGEKEWVPVLEEFWAPFKTTVDAKADIPREEVNLARPLGTDPKSGKPVSVRLGRYGPFAQIGTKDDADKPKFASLRPGQSLETISLDEALFLFQLPRKLGTTAEGETVEASVGRFGPYIKYGKKFVSLKPDDPYTVTLERALEVIAQKITADANRIIRVFDGTDIQVLNGRYGPYITDGKKNGKIPKERDPKTLTQAECEAILAAAPEKGRGFGRKKAAPAPTAPPKANAENATRSKPKAAKSISANKSRKKAKPRVKEKIKELV